MSESSKEKKAASLHRARLFIIIIIIAVVSLLGLGYLSGYFILPEMIKSAYQAGNCPAALSRNDTFSKIYPFANVSEENKGGVRECAIYTLGVTSMDTEAWHDAYNAFSVYQDIYPQGIFTGVVYENSAVALIGMVNEDIEQENYSRADAGINFILENYGDTPTAEDAEKLKSSLKLGLGTDLRETGDFAGSEQIFKEINAQAQENNWADDVRSSQLELAKTYLAWGLDLQAQEKFAEAKDKFDLAISTDPDPSSASGPAAQAKTGQLDLYTKWGDYLIGQKDFANAMNRYETAASLSEDQSKANDLIANGYVQWAAELSDEEDFLGALVLLDFAQERSVTDAAKALVSDARSDLYLAFSKSDGDQAQQAIEDAVRIVCTYHIQPSLPIFGLDDEHVRAGVDGVDGQLLPESIAATTPASLLFVFCVEENTKLVGTLTLPISTTMFGGGPGTVQVTYANYQYIWNVVLSNASTGEEVAEFVIEGVEPAELIPFNIDITTYNYFGSKPDIADLVDFMPVFVE